MVERGRVKSDQRFARTCLRDGKFADFDSVDTGPTPRQRTPDHHFALRVMFHQTRSLIASGVSGTSCACRSKQSIPRPVCAGTSGECLFVFATP